VTWDGAGNGRRWLDFAAMARAAVCPPELLRRVFRGTEVVADGLITTNRLRHRMWSRFGRDVYVLAEHHEALWARREALRLMTDDGHVACGLTAAWLHGIWEPRPGLPVPLQISHPSTSHGRAVVGHARRRLTWASAEDSTTGTDIVEVDGIAVTSPLRTCFDLMRNRLLVEAVVVADAFLRQAAVDPLSLALYCQERVRWPGVRRARLAVNLASPFARSAGESRLRAVLVLAGFEQPLVNVPVVDGAGRQVATPDLQVRGRRWAWLEYDGAYHDEARQHDADVRRENRLTVASGGVPVLRYDARHLRIAAGRAQVVGEVASATGTHVETDLRPRDFARPLGDQAW
jgi:hypothetical protein